MAQDQNLQILGGSAASEQPEPAEDCDTEQIQQSEQHGSRSCQEHVEPTKRSSRTCNEFWHVRGVAPV
jgi:hypothetical protein